MKSRKERDSLPHRVLRIPFVLVWTEQRYTKNERLSKYLGILKKDQVAVTRLYIF